MTLNMEHSDITSNINWLSTILVNLGGRIQEQQKLRLEKLDTQENPPARVFMRELIMLISIVLCVLCYHSDIL